MTPVPPHPNSSNDKKQRRFEDIFIILCIFSLWPVVLGWRAPIYEFLLYAALVGLVIVFIRRTKRLRRAKDNLGGGA
jgi:hypothetical protein